MVDQFMVKKKLVVIPMLIVKIFGKVDAGVYVRPSSEPLSSTRDENSNTRSQATKTDHFDDEL